MSQLLPAALLIMLLQLDIEPVKSVDTNTKLQAHLNALLREQQERRIEGKYFTYSPEPFVGDESSLYREEKLYSKSSHKIERRKRSVRQPAQVQSDQLVDACQSKMEVITPYYATNSKGKLRTVVNSELMQQAIQIETCVR